MLGQLLLWLVKLLSSRIDSQGPTTSVVVGKHLASGKYRVFFPLVINDRRLTLTLFPSMDDSMFRLSALVLVLFSVAACKEEDKFDAGYDDGFASGYNTACEIRATLIEGDWDSQSYTRGYNEGNAAGILECNRCRDKRPSADCP